MSDIPAVTAAQMAKIDELLQPRFGLASIQVMEHAGHAVATFARMLFPDADALDQPVTILAGSGGNGGDALVAARLLSGWGARVTVVLSKPAERYKGLAASHLATIQALGIPVLDGDTVDALPPSGLIIDGLLGFSTTLAPTGTTAKLIELANDDPAYVLAIDAPSGMDSTTGAVFEPCIVASGTVTLGLPKTGLMVEDAVDNTGSLVLVDIGIPAQAYAEIGVTVPDDLFSSTWLLPLRGLDDEGSGALRNY